MITIKISGGKMAATSQLEASMNSCEFFEKYDKTEIELALRTFANHHSRELPGIMYNSHDIVKSMLDVLKVRGTNLYLPVIILSTRLLRSINFVSGYNLVLCLCDEDWPYRNRIELVGDSYGVGIEDVEVSLFNYLKSSIEDFEHKGLDCTICVSERVEKIATTGPLRSLIECVDVLPLTESYKEAVFPLFD